MKKIIQTDSAPAAIGPYSQAIITGNLMFVSGQLAIDPSTGKLINGTMTEQTRLILTNLSAIIEEAGADISKVVKTTLFLQDMNDFTEVNKAYGSFFEVDPPARSTVQVAALPLDAKIEIDAVISLA